MIKAIERAKSEKAALENNSNVSYSNKIKQKGLQSDSKFDSKPSLSLSSKPSITAKSTPTSSYYTTKKPVTTSALATAKPSTFSASSKFSSKPSTTNSLNAQTKNSPTTIKSSYYKNTGKYSKDKQQALGDAENELLIMSLFDDDDDVDTTPPPPPPQKYQKQKQEQPKPISIHFSSLDTDSESEEEAPIDFGEWFDDIFDSTTSSDVPTQQVPPPPVKSDPLYPFFEDSSIGVKSLSSDVAVSNDCKPKQLKRYAYICKQNLPPPYTDTKVGCLL